MAEEELVSNTTAFTPTYNSLLDTLYGAMFFACFVVGSLGNITCFLFFRSRKRDVSNWIYQVVTVNDFVLCVCGVPVGLAFLNSRSPGAIFGTPWSCSAWSYTWNSNCRLSVFLVVVLCCSRTWSLLQPFCPQRIRVVSAVVLVYFLFTILQLIGFHVQDGIQLAYSPSNAICGLAFEANFDRAKSTWIGILLEVGMIVTFCLPLFVVIISSTISTYLLDGQRSSTVECSSASAKRLTDSRHKASITILIFAVVYGFFNVPLVVYFIINAVESHTGVSYKDSMFSFDWEGPEYFLYFSNYVYTMSTILNSTINPLLYLWRMPDCIKCISMCMKKMSGKVENYRESFDILNSRIHG